MKVSCFISCGQIVFIFKTTMSFLQAILPPIAHSAYLHEF